MFQNGFKAGKKRKASDSDGTPQAKKPYSNFVKVYTLFLLILNLLPV